MLSYDVFLVLSAILALASGHAQLINIQGEPGSPASVGFKGTITTKYENLSVH
jgi:hypothetical protein